MTTYARSPLTVQPFASILQHTPHTLDKTGQPFVSASCNAWVLHVEKSMLYARRKLKSKLPNFKMSHEKKSYLRISVKSAVFQS